MFWNNVMVSSSRVDVFKKCPRMYSWTHILVHFDPSGWNHYIVSKHREPITTMEASATQLRKPKNSHNTSCLCYGKGVCLLHQFSLSFYTCSYSNSFLKCFVFSVILDKVILWMICSHQWWHSFRHVPVRSVKLAQHSATAGCFKSLTSPSLLIHTTSGKHRVLPLCMNLGLGQLYNIPVRVQFPFKEWPPAWGLEITLCLCSYWQYVVG
jgi:hypothetical protein